MSKGSDKIKRGEQVQDKKNLSDTVLYPEKDYKAIGQKTLTVAGEPLNHFLSRSGDFETPRNIRSSDIDFQLASSNRENLNKIPDSFFKKVGLKSRQDFISGGNPDEKSLENSIYNTLLNFKINQYDNIVKSNTTFEDAGLRMTEQMFDGFGNMDEQQKQLFTLLQSQNSQEAEYAYETLIYLWNRAASRYRSTMREKINANEIAPEALKKRAQMLTGLSKEMGGLGTQNWNLLTKDFNGAGGALMLSMLCPPTSLLFILPILLPGITSIASGVISQRSNEKALTEQEIYALNKSEIVAADIMSCSIFESIISDVIEGKSMATIEERAFVYAASIGADLKNNETIDNLTDIFKDLSADSILKEGSPELKTFTTKLAMEIGPYVDKLNSHRRQKALSRQGLDQAIGKILSWNSQQPPKDPTESTVEIRTDSINGKTPETTSVPKNKTMSKRVENSPTGKENISNALIERLALCKNEENQRDVVENYFTSRLFSYFETDAVGNIKVRDNDKQACYELGIQVTDKKDGQDMIFDLPKAMLQRAKPGILTGKFIANTKGSDFLDFVESYLDSDDVINSAIGSSTYSLVTIQGLLREDLYKNATGEEKKKKRREIFKKYLAFIAIASLPANIKTGEDKGKDVIENSITFLKRLKANSGIRNQDSILSTFSNNIDSLIAKDDQITLPILSCLKEVVEKERLFLQKPGDKSDDDKKSLDESVDKLIQEYDKMINVDNPIQKDQNAINLVSAIRNIVNISSRVTYNNNPNNGEDKDLNTGNWMASEPFEPFGLFGR